MGRSSQISRLALAALAACALAIGGCNDGGDGTPVVEAVPNGQPAPDALPLEAADERQPVDRSLPVVTTPRWPKVWDEAAVGSEGSRLRLVGRVFALQPGGFFAWGDLDQDRHPAKVLGRFEELGPGDFVLVTGAIRGADTYDLAAGGEAEVITVDGRSAKRIERDEAVELAAKGRY